MDNLLNDPAVGYMAQCSQKPRPLFGKLYSPACVITSRQGHDHDPLGSSCYEPG
jgi:hypothetical protein